MNRTPGCLKEEMKSKQGDIVAVKNEQGAILALKNEIQWSNTLKDLEILALKNEIQRSNALKEEMESKQGEILSLKDKLQGAKTTLLDFQNRSREKFEEQQQELESSKTKMEEYKDETVILKDKCRKCECLPGLDFSTYTIPLGVYNCEPISIIRQKGRSNRIPGRGRRRICNFPKDYS